MNLVETDCIRYIYSSSNYRHLDWAISELLKMFKIEERVDVGINQVNIMARYIQSIKANSLKRMYPNLAAEWACEHNGSIMPDMVTAGSHREVYWKCKNGHIYSASINARVRYYKQGKYFGCQYCSGHKALPGYNDLQTKYPDIAKEWDWEKNEGVTPFDVTTGSSRKKYWWLCKVCGHSWLATVSNRSQGRGCPMCKPREIAKKLIQRAAIIESFASTFPELVCEWDSSNSISPSDVAPHSNQRVMWVCSKCGNKWTTTVNNRAAGYGCRECYLRNRTIENKKSVVCVETCELFESIAVASQKMSISRTGISNCLSGRSKSAGGYHWKYGEEDPS